MTTKYTSGYQAAMFSDWLKPYMMEYQRNQEEADYRAPLGERNMGILNAVLAGATTVKSINDLMQMKKAASDDTSVMASGGPVKKYQNGGGLDSEYSELFKKVKTPDIKEISKAEALGLKMETGVSEGLGALGAVETLRDRNVSKTQKIATAHRLAEQGAEMLAKKASKEVGETVAGKVLGKVAPGIGVATGIEKIAKGDTPYEKGAGVLEAAGGAAKVIPGLGTAVGGILDVAALGVEGIGALVDNKKKGPRYIATMGGSRVV